MIFNYKLCNFTGKSGSSSSRAGNGASAFDVNIGSRFHTDQEEMPWVIGDLEQVYTIIGARLISRHDGAAGRFGW